MEDANLAEIAKNLKEKLRRGEISRRDFFEMMLLLGAGLVAPTLGSIDEATAAIGARMRKSRRLNASGIVYVDDVFSNYLYTGNAATQAVTNGIDLSVNGGLVWCKARDLSQSNYLFDTARGSNVLWSDLTSSQSGYSTFTFNNDGFSIASGAGPNNSGYKYASWTFRKAAKFFDVVSYTGNGSAPRALNHSLGVRPGVVIIKRTDSTGNWWVFHRSAPNQGAAYPSIGGNLYLDLTDPADTGTNPFLSACDSSTFTLSTNQNGTMNINGATYIAYLFAHDTDTTSGIIQCGSFTTDGSGAANVNLGWEPQWCLVKNTGTENWGVYDVMRGWDMAGSDKYLIANSTAVEGSANIGNPTATGMAWNGLPVSSTFIYMAIRRPNKPPSIGTQVYSCITRTGANSGSRLLTGVGFAPDMILNSGRTNLSDGTVVVDRLRGGGTTVNTTNGLRTWLTNVESGIGGVDFSASMDGFLLFDDGQANWSNSAYTYVDHLFKRAPGFFDIVCYTGDDDTARVLVHNLNVPPELVIFKTRNTVQHWQVLTDFTDSGTGAAKRVMLDGDYLNFGPGHITAVSSSSITINGSSNVSSTTYVAYLFASLHGISKVGTYTGSGGSSGTNGTSQTINCGFSGGARFVLIKRTDSTGDWMIWDTNRGIVAGNDPHLALNNTNAEDTSSDSLDPENSGFAVNQISTTNLNVTGATYIFLAIS